MGAPTLPGTAPRATARGAVRVAAAFATTSGIRAAAGLATSATSRIIEATAPRLLAKVRAPEISGKLGVWAEPNGLSILSADVCFPSLESSRQPLVANVLSFLSAD